MLGTGVVCLLPFLHAARVYLIHFNSQLTGILIGVP